MIRALLRWLGLTLLALICAAALIYVGDFALFHLRGKPVDQVVITRYMSAPLKNHKTELFYEGTGPAPCSRTLFPQSGMPPCWYLRRHPLAADNL
jgi:hypothetical protein